MLILTIEHKIPEAGQQHSREPPKEKLEPKTFFSFQYNTSPAEKDDRVSSKQVKKKKKKNSEDIRTCKLESSKKNL